MTDGPLYWYMSARPQIIAPRVWTPIWWDWRLIDTHGDQEGPSPDVVLPWAGVYAAVAGISWEADPVGARSVRFMQEGFACAQQDWPGIGAEDLEPITPALQRTACVMQPGTHRAEGSSFRIEIWHSAKRSLTVYPDGLQGPIMMAAYLGRFEGAEAP